MNGAMFPIPSDEEVRVQYSPAEWPGNMLKELGVGGGGKATNRLNKYSGSRTITVGPTIRAFSKSLLDWRVPFASKEEVVGEIFLVQLSRFNDQN